MRRIIGDLKKKSLISYILAFSGIVMLIILVMGAYLYQFYYRTIYKDFVKANESYLSSVCVRHENDMEIMEDIAMQMGLPSKNAEFKLKEAPMKSIALEEQLYSYVSVSRFFHQLYYFYHEDTYLYNQTTSVSLDRFLEEGLRLEHRSKEEFSNLLYSKEKGMKVLEEQIVQGYLSQIFSSIASRAVVYIKSVEPKNTSTMLFVVGNEYYNELLSSEEQDIRQTYIIYEGSVIVSRGTLPIDENILLENLTDTPGAPIQIKAAGSRYLLSTRQGESGVTYCTVQPMEIFQNKILTGQWGILFVLSICSIPTSLAIVGLSRHIAKRVRNINVLLSEDEDAYYNLENIETGIRTLVEINKEVNRESLILRRTRFISNFVRGEYTSRKAAVRAGEKVNLYVDSRYFMVVLMGDRGNSNESKAHEMMLSEITVQDNEDGFGIHLIQNNQSMFVIFGDDVRSMQMLFERFFLIGKEYCDEFVMSISGVHEEFADASKAYLEASAAYDNRFLVDNSRIIHFADVADREQVEILPDTYFRRLKNAIRSNDEAEADKVILEICSFLRSSRQSLLTFRILYNNIIHMMLTEWNTNDTSFDNIYNVFTLSQCLTIQDFNDILCEVCHKLMNTKTETGSENTDMVTDAIQYMKSGYENPDLNMSSLSEYLNVSGVKLAVQFKNTMGISPSDYLAIIRMEQAKILLRETGLRVKEVSAAVGYEDDHVFMRRFKKYAGKTPGQYRTEGKGG